MILVVGNMMMLVFTYFLVIVMMIYLLSSVNRSVWCSEKLVVCAHADVLMFCVML